MGKAMKERNFDKIMFCSIKIKDITFQVVDLLFILCLFVFGFFIRWKLMPIESADYFGFLEDWMRQIREGGGFASLGYQISNYTSPYMYIMCLVSYISKNDLYALKLVSVLFDYVAAVAMFSILYRITGKVRRSVLGMAAVLLSPTVILDGAYWCQCDIIYSAFILWGLYRLFQKDSRGCMIFVGIAFAFKQQTLFILPFLVILWLKEETVRFRDFVYLPLLYVLGAVPAWLMGRDLKELLLIYVDQSGTYPWGTLEYPNIYALLGEAMPDMRHAGEVSGAGIFMTVILLGCLAYYLYTKKVRMGGELVVTLALFTVALCVYCLPHMHDRYGFLVDLLAIAYGFINRKKLPVMCGYFVVSILTFMPYLIAVHLVPIQYLALFALGLLVYVGYDLQRQIKENSL